MLRDGTHFAIVAGTDRPRSCIRIRRGGGCRRRRWDRRRRSRAAAARIATRLIATGGTAIGTWLARAGELLAGSRSRSGTRCCSPTGTTRTGWPEAAGSGAHREPGNFTCDARGIGDGWDPRELKKIMPRLHGGADAVLGDSELATEFQTMMERAMAKAVPDLRLRVSHRMNSEIRYVKQVYPSERT